MEIDQQLLADLEGQPILHFYDWEGDAATYGYFIKPQDFLNLEEAKRLGLSLARRPTGGGIVFHTWDLAFSILIPATHPAFSLNTLDRYKWINERVVEALKPYLTGTVELLPQDPTPQGHFCMAKPTIYDIMVDGRKLGGAAQRKTRRGFLHQGTIALTPPSIPYLKSILLPDTGVLEAMQATTFTLFPDTPLEKGRIDVRHSLLNTFSLS